MRKRKPKPGQHGKYWLSKKPGREGDNDPWCATWYDKFARQTRRVSLGTADVQEASIALSKWAILNDRPMNGSPDQVLIEAVLIRYLEEHAKGLSSARTTKDNLAYWQEFWAGKYVSEITPHEQVKFQQFIRRDKLKNSSVDRILSAGRAALRRAVKFQELTVAPQIFKTETKQEFRARSPLARPINIPEMAALFDNVDNPQLYVFLLIAANTLSRPGAIYDLRRSQFDSVNSRLDLNPAGREQTSKFRPIVPVSSTLRPWLEAVTDQNDYYVTMNGGPMNDVRTAFERALKAAELEAGIAAYSFRHGMAREIRNRGVSLDEIGLMLGHISDDGNSITRVYAPDKPEYCNNAVAAIDAIMMDVCKLMKSAKLNDPLAVQAHLDSVRPNKGYLSENLRREIRRLLETGLGVSKIASQLGLAVSTVYYYERR